MPKNKAGRPAIWTGDRNKEAKEIILEGVASGLPLSTICKTDNRVPGLTTVFKWLNEDNEAHDSEFMKAYARAKEASAEVDADKIQVIAEGTLAGVYTANAAKVAIDALKWAAAHKRPTKYGSKIDITSDNEKIMNVPLISFVKSAKENSDD